MAKMFCIVQMSGGAPLLSTLPYAGYALVDELNGYGAYLISGTNQQLLDLNALPQVIGIVGVSDSGVTHWGELDGVIAAGVRTKLNTWLTARGFQNIPAGWTYRQVLNSVFVRFNALFDLTGIDIADS